MPANDVVRLLNDSGAIAVTTMLDYYGLPHDTPGLGDPRAGNCYMILDRPATLFQNIVAQVSSPEEINEGRHTHPSARMLSLAPGYEKPFHGGLIALETGLAQIRQKCPHFAGWVEWLELLAQP